MSGAMRYEPSIADVVADMTGQSVRRLHDDRRLTGIPGWHVGTRIFEARSAEMLAESWRQVSLAAECTGLAPALLFRAGSDEWRAIWPAGLQLLNQDRRVWTDFAWTIEAAVPVWAAASREIAQAAEKELNGTAAEEQER